MKSDDLDAVYRLYAQSLRVYALSLSGDPHLAESLVSDTFYHALLAGPPAHGNWKPWLLRICKNGYLDHLRRLKRHPSATLEEAPPLPDGILDSLILDERRRALGRAVAALPQPYRECVLLHYFCNCPLKEIAAVLGVTPGAARTMLYRARGKLRPLLEEESL